MNFDAVLPVTLSAFIIAVMFLFQRIEKDIRLLFEKDVKFQTRDVVILVAVMGVMITVMALVPDRVLQIFYTAAISYMLFSFTNNILKKWYLALAPPAIFVLCYLFMWNIITFNIFAFSFAAIVISYLTVFFNWKTTLVFAGLLTGLDVFQVFITGFMGQLAEKAVFNLQLPVVIMIPTYPTIGRIILGIGDILLSGLLTNQNMLRQGRRSGILTAMSIGIAMFVFELVELNADYFRYFPATIVVLLGWLLGLGLTRLCKKLVKRGPLQGQS
jgi:hypothetical protein